MISERRKRAQYKKYQGVRTDYTPMIITIVLAEQKKAKVYSTGPEKEGYF